MTCAAPGQTLGGQGERDGHQAADIGDATHAVTGSELKAFNDLSVAVVARRLAPGGREQTSSRAQP